MLKPSVEVEDFKNYLKEVKLMASIGQHPNVIGFYGAVIEKLDQSELIISMFHRPKGHILITWLSCRNFASRVGVESAWKFEKILAGEWKPNFGWGCKAERFIF